MKDRDYNKELVKRGEMLIDLSLFESLTTPDAKPKRGRPYTYPKALILLLLPLKFSLRLLYRQTEELTRKIFSYLNLATSKFRTLHYRLTKEEINSGDLPQIEKLQDDFVIVLESIGLKVTNIGEWLRKKHGKRARRGWIKLHFDINSKQVISVEADDERTHDSQKAEELVETARQKAKEKCKRVEKVIADRGYDTHRIFRYMHERGIEPCILLRSSAKKSMDNKSISRFGKLRRMWYSINRGWNFDRSLKFALLDRAVG
ncbi:MAG: IS5 family transposase [Candidatus Aenigmatarchaeota archaeon]